MEGRATHVQDDHAAFSLIVHQELGKCTICRVLKWNMSVIPAGDDSRSNLLHEG